MGLRGGRAGEEVTPMGGTAVRSTRAGYSFAYLGISYAPGSAEGGLRI